MRRLRALVGHLWAWLLLALVIVLIVADRADAQTTTTTAPPVTVTVDLGPLGDVIRTQHTLDRMRLDDIEAETALVADTVADHNARAAETAARLDRLAVGIDTAVGLLGLLVALAAATWVRTMLRERTPRADR